MCAVTLYARFFAKVVYTSHTQTEGYGKTEKQKAETDRVTDVSVSRTLRTHAQACAPARRS